LNAENEVAIRMLIRFPYQNSETRGLRIVAMVDVDLVLGKTSDQPEQRMWDFVAGENDLWAHLEKSRAEHVAEGMVFFVECED